jgi:short-subunit dehydrogenase
LKNVVITGASSGFGYLTAITLARRGFKVWATMRNPDGKNKLKRNDLKHIANTENLHIRVAELDVTRDFSIKELKRLIIEEDGQLDILINNAGIMLMGITEAYSLNQVKDQFDTNFYGVIRTTKAFLPLLKESKDGLIINISSLAGRLIFPYMGLYCASKFALEAYSETIRYELKPLGVDVSIIEPGPYPTGPVNRGPQEEDTEALETYGEMRQVPKKLLEGFEGFFRSSDAPNPQEIPDAIYQLITMQHGTRPIRKVVGIDYGTDELNTKVGPIQEMHLKNNLQMGELI